MFIFDLLLQSIIHSFMLIVLLILFSYLILLCLVVFEVIILFVLVRMYLGGAGVGGGKVIWGVLGGDGIGGLRGIGIRTFFIF